MPRESLWPWDSISGFILPKKKTSQEFLTGDFFRKLPFEMGASLGENFLRALLKKGASIQIESGAGPGRL